MPIDVQHQQEVSGFKAQPFLPEADIDYVNTDLEYLPLNQPLQASSSHFVKYPPSNGGTYNSKSQYIEFRIQPEHNAFLDGSETKLCCQFQAKPVNISGNTTTFGIYSTGSLMNAVNKIEITCGGNVLESISDFNRIQHCFSQLYCSRQQLGASPSVTDLYTNQVGTQYGAGIVGQKMSLPTDADPSTASNLVCKVYQLSVPIPLSALIGQGSRKCVPLGLLREAIQIRLYLTSNVPEVYYAKGGTNSVVGYDVTSDYSISNVSLQCKIIRFSEIAFKAIRDHHADNVLEWDGDTFISNINRVHPSATAVRALMGDTNYKDCKSIINQTWYSQITTSTVTFASNLCGLYSYNIRINGRNVNSRNQGNQILSHLNCSQSQFAMNLLSIARRSTETTWCENQLSCGYATGGAVVSYGMNPYAFSTGFPIQPVTGPDKTPSCLVSQFIGRANVGTETTQGYVGTSLLKSADTHRVTKGVDCRSSQVVVLMDRFNTISSGAHEQILQSILHVGETFMLDVKSGTLRRDL